jgi:Emfourin
LLLLIEFTRSGGVAGIRLNKTFNTDSMPVETAAEIINLVHAADFFHLPASISSGGADKFHYKLFIEENDKSHTVQVDERAIPEALAPLLRRLESDARVR